MRSGKVSNKLSPQSPGSVHGCRMLIIVLSQNFPDLDDLSKKNSVPTVSILALIIENHAAHHIFRLYTQNYGISAPTAHLRSTIVTTPHRTDPILKPPERRWSLPSSRRPQLDIHPVGRLQAVRDLFQHNGISTVLARQRSQQMAQGKMTHNILWHLFLGFLVSATTTAAHAWRASVQPFGQMAIGVPRLSKAPQRRHESRRHVPFFIFCRRVARKICEQIYCGAVGLLPQLARRGSP